MHFFQSLQEIKWKRLGVILCLLILAILAGYYIASSQNYYRTEGKDFFPLWLAPHLLIGGNNPYDSSHWISAYEMSGAKWVQDEKFLYPLPLAVLLIPLGFLPLEYAAVTWIA